MTDGPVRWHRRHCGCCRHRGNGRHRRPRNERWGGRLLEGQQLRPWSEPAHRIGRPVAAAGTWPTEALPRTVTDGEACEGLGFACSTLAGELLLDGLPVPACALICWLVGVRADRAAALPQLVTPRARISKRLFDTGRRLQKVTKTQERAVENMPKVSSGRPRLSSVSAASGRARVRSPRAVPPSGAALGAAGSPRHAAARRCRRVRAGPAARAARAASRRPSDS